MRKHCIFLISGLVALCCLSTADAVIFPFEIFTNNGEFNNDPAAVFKIDVTEDNGQVNFVFYNDSTIDCSISRIYFDGGDNLSLDEIINGPGTNFGPVYPGPGNLPAGKTLNPPFIADREFNIGAVQPPPKNGLNGDSGEWVQIKFDLINGTFSDVINDLNTGELRVGIHVQAFPDGSSESAINYTPEPASICLFALGSLFLLRKRK